MSTGVITAATVETWVAIVVIVKGARGRAAATTAVGWRISRRALVAFGAALAGGGEGRRSRKDAGGRALIKTLLCFSVK